MRRSMRGFTLVEIMIVVAIIALLAAIAIPNVLRGRTTANESASIGNLRALVSSLEMYRSVNGEYVESGPAWDTRMFGACPGGAGAPDPDFGPPSFCVGDLTAAPVQGYNYTYTQPGTQQYDILAVPTNLGRTGTRSFLADESGVIRHCVGTGTVVQLSNAPTVDAPPEDPCA